MTHGHGVDAEPVHRFAWDTFVELTEVAKRLHLYGAGQDLLATRSRSMCAVPGRGG
jgi:fructose 1,6-bisphosphate aldolase/phosphatase